MSIEWRLLVLLLLLIIIIFFIEWSDGVNKNTNVPFSFRRVVWVLLRPLWFDHWKRDEGEKEANDLKSSPNDAILWTETRS